MTITHVTAATAAHATSPQHESISLLLDEAAELVGRPGLHQVLALVRTALDHDALTSELAHRLGSQLRLLAGPAPLDADEIDEHLVLQALLFELSEIAAQVDGVHVDDLAPRIEALLDAGDGAAAQRLMLLADVAHARLRTMTAPLSGQLVGL